MSVANRSLRPKRTKNKKPSVKGLPPFVNKLYTIVEDSSTDQIISWGPTGATFIVHRPEELSSIILPLYFKHNNYCSFIRQVNTYGFTKVDTDNWEFANEFFKKGQPDLLPQIVRRTSVKRSPESQKEEKKSKSKIKEGDVSMQVAELAKQNYSLQKELDKLKEERETHDQLVHYFMDELKQSREKQKELIERERQMLGLLQKMIQSPEAEIDIEEWKNKLHSLSKRLFTPSVPHSASSGDHQPNGNVKNEFLPENKTSQPSVLLRSSHVISDSTVPSSPLWNSWPAEYFGNLLEEHADGPDLASTQHHLMVSQPILDDQLDADLASMVDDLSFESNFSANSQIPTTKRQHAAPFPFAPMPLLNQGSLQQSHYPSASPTAQAALPSYRFQPSSLNFNGNNSDFSTLQVPQSPLPVSPPPSPLSSLLSFQVKTEPLTSASSLGSHIPSMPSSPLSGIPSSPLPGDLSSPLPGTLVPVTPPAPDETSAFSVLDAPFVLHNPEDCQHIEELAGQLQMTMTSG